MACICALARKTVAMKQGLLFVIEHLENPGNLLQCLRLNHWDSALWQVVDDLRPKWKAMNLHTLPVDHGRYYFLREDEEILGRLEWRWKSKPSFIQWFDALRTDENASLLINVNNRFRFVQRFGNDVEPDSAIVEQLDAVMELKRVVYALLANLKETETLRTRTVISALSWGLSRFSVSVAPTAS